MNKIDKWIKVKLGDIADQILDRIDNPNNSALSYYIGLEHLESENITIKSYGSSKDVKSSKFLCKKGDIILGRRRAYLKKLAVSEKDALVSTDAIILRPKFGVNKNILLSILQSEKFWLKAISLSAGSLSPRVKWKDLAELKFLMPPEKEQKIISEVLGSIEDNIKKTEKLIEVNGKMKRGLLNELLTQGIGHKKFKKTEIGKIPEDWELCQIKNLGVIRTSGVNKKINPNEKDINLVNYMEVYNNFKKEISKNTKFMRVTAKKNQLSANNLIVGDVLFTPSSETKEDIGHSAVVIEKLPENTLYSYHLVRLRFNREIYLNFKKYLFNNPFVLKQFEEKSSGITRMTLKLKDFGDTKVIIPPLKEQKIIAKILEEIDNFIISNIKNLITLTNLKKKLTNELISGKLRLA